jgi:RNA polymerase sigma-70 factor (ECF subfamily)
VPQSPPPHTDRSPRAFMTTHWSVVLAAVGDRASPSAAGALSTLCATYWYPLYAFVRRQGHPPDEAEDLTQAFFERVLEKGYLDAVVGPEKGKFRTFLLVCLKRFLANEWDRARALKRGGGRAHLPIGPSDLDDAEGRYALEPSHELTPEKLYERRWALTVLQQTLLRLEQEMRQAGKGRLFDALKQYLVAEHNAPSYAETGGPLGMTEGAVKVAVHRLRERYRNALREEIAATLDDPTKVDEEVRDLFAALAM